MKGIQHIKTILTALLTGLFAIALDFVAHKAIFEPAYATFEPEIFRYFAVKFLVIFIIYILFMYIFAYSKRFVSSIFWRPVVIAFAAMMVFAIYYYFYPSNTNPAALPFSFFPFMGLNHFLDILISSLVVESIASKGRKEKPRFFKSYNKK